MTDDHYMKIALREAQKAFEAEEVPVGAIIVQSDRIIARGYNQVETPERPDCSRGNSCPHLGL